MAEGSTSSLVLAIFFLVLWVVVWTICLIGWRVAYLRHAHPSLPSRLSTLSKTAVPGVTIIRPICGLDDNLYNALQASMRFDYPKYQVIFALQNEEDEAIPVVRMIMERYPDVDSRLIIDSHEVGVNPKINNLLTPFSEAKYDLLWVIDSTISVVPGTLARAVDAFMGTSFSFASEGASSFDSAGEMEATPLLSDGNRAPPQRGDVGLVHHVPFAVVHQKTLGSLVEMAFLNTTHAKMYLAINYLAVDSCVMGKSNLYSRTSIASLTTPSPTLSLLPSPPTGLAGFSPFLAEDNMLGLALWHQLGLKHSMTPDVALDFLGRLSLADYIRRRVRWIRVRKRMTPVAATIMEPFTESILCGVYGAWAIQRLFGSGGMREGMVMWAVHMAVWVMLDLSVRRSLGNSARPPKSSSYSGFGPSTGLAGAIHGRENDTGTRARVVGAPGPLPSDSTPLFLLAWTIREVLALPIFLYGVWGSEVLWRGRRYRVVRNGEAERVG